MYQVLYMNNRYWFRTERFPLCLLKRKVALVVFECNFVFYNGNQVEIMEKKVHINLTLLNMPSRWQCFHLKIQAKYKLITADSIFLVLLAETFLFIASMMSKVSCTLASIDLFYFVS